MRFLKHTNSGSPLGKKKKEKTNKNEASSNPFTSHQKEMTKKKSKACTNMAGAKCSNIPEPPCVTSSQKLHQPHQFTQTRPLYSLPLPFGNSACVRVPELVPFQQPFSQGKVFFHLKTTPSGTPYKEAIESLLF